MAFPSDPKAGFLALNRFGYGPHGDGDAEAAARDPRGFLEAELSEPGLALLSGAGLPTSAEAAKLFFADQDQKKAERERQVQQLAQGKPADAAAMQPAAPQNGSADAMAPNTMAANMMTKPTAPDAS